MGNTEDIVSEPCLYKMYGVENCTSSVPANTFYCGRLKCGKAFTACLSCRNNKDYRHECDSHVFDSWKKYPPTGRK